ncbi:hypothetical protein O6H91_18G051600 [Diphasiastrum complanatum]|uniref:Uncharacterized protein n=1 Tax=Diphasiastrum complanatum TaxID=34168 RepID=A0ACC2B139_DIPCM|nr:hypothetical protein O6H91_18G051600 [Diphasiastrum complanatum]
MKEVGVMSPHGQTLARLGSPLNEKGRYARERINTYKYDIDAWTTLASEAQARPISEAAPLYEELLATFPTAAKYWKAYVEAHISTNSDDAAKHIFSRCLLNCLHIELWKCYIRFIRKVNDSKGQDGRDETKKAYDFMLGRIGMDIAAGPMWLEYIAFLRTAPVTAPQEDSQRMTSVRKAYQKAILAPIHHVEQLWKEYENFENSISRALAKGLLAEYQPKHFSARAVYRERKKFCERIDQNMLAVPPTGSIKEEQQLTAWKQLLAFEKANPQRLEPSALTKRVAFTYEQCLMYLYHYPDVWYDYATWHAQNGSPDSAVVVFQRALKALPDTTVLYYAYAEFEEARGSIKEAKRVYESLLRNSSTANALAYIQYMRFTRRTEGSEGARKIFFEARKAPACTYHVYVASAAMVLCIDKDPKAARTIFELGLKKYIHEPAYVLEYADFLCRLNDERNVRVLFERALSVLPPEESIEVWNCFMAFEQLYGDIPSMLKVEQRRKEALSQTGDDGVAAAESSLQQLITRYRFLDLWPCSSGDLDHLVRQQMMAQRLSGKTEQQALTSGSGNGMGGNERAIPASGTEGLAASFPGGHIVRPDLAQMIVYDPKQGLAYWLASRWSNTWSSTSVRNWSCIGFLNFGASSWYDIWPISTWAATSACTRSSASWNHVFCRSRRNFEFFASIIELFLQPSASREWAISRYRSGIIHLIASRHTICSIRRCYTTSPISSTHWQPQNKCSNQFISKRIIGCKPGAYSGRWSNRVTI